MSSGYFKESNAVVSLRSEIDLLFAPYLYPCQSIRCWLKSNKGRQVRSTLTALAESQLELLSSALPQHAIQLVACLCTLCPAACLSMPSRCATLLSSALPQHAIQDCHWGVPWKACADPSAPCLRIPCERPCINLQTGWFYMFKESPWLHTKSVVNQECFLAVLYLCISTCAPFHAKRVPGHGERRGCARACGAARESAPRRHNPLHGYRGIYRDVQGACCTPNDGPSQGKHASAYTHTSKHTFKLRNLQHVAACSGCLGFALAVQMQEACMGLIYSIDRFQIGGGNCKPVEVMVFLNTLFSTFDRLVDIHGVHKVWSIDGLLGMQH
eukprot:1162108-Pelagomonas_calceolata.AAC.6